jgi:hypothetical protein
LYIPELGSVLAAKKINAIEIAPAGATGGRLQREKLNERGRNVSYSQKLPRYSS